MAVTAPFNKYNIFREHLYDKVHDLMGTAGASADTLKVLLSNQAPNPATHVFRADVAEIAAASGYPAGGLSLSNVGSRAGGVFTLVATDVTVQATAGATIGPFRYAIVYNSTVAGGPLLGWYDYTQSISLTDPESFTVDFGASLFTDS